MSTISQGPEQGDLEGDAGEPKQAIARLTFVLVYLGAASGSLIGAYYMSIGYYQEKFDSLTLFGFQALVVLAVQFVTTLMQSCFDEDYDRRFGIISTVGFRIIFTGIVGAAVLLFSPLAWTPAAVLILGAIVSFLATSQGSSSAQLGAAITAGGNTMVILGIRVGGLVPLLAVRLTDFTPNSTVTTAETFFITVSVVAACGIANFAYYHYAASQTPSTSSRLRRASSEDTTSEDHLHATYQTLSASVAGPGQSSTASSLGWWQVFVLIVFFCSLLPTPLFPLVGPRQSPQLVTDRLIGDALGSVTGLAHSKLVGASGRVSDWLKVSCYGVALIRAVATGFLVKVLMKQDEEYIQRPCSN